MPYITKDKRAYFTLDDYAPAEIIVSNAGELNYLVTVLINNYLKVYGKNYANINEMIGALECCKLELYRRIAAPYEDIKMQENGDVYYG